MTDSIRWHRSLVVLALALALIVPGAASPVLADGRILYLPLLGKSFTAPSGPIVEVSGHVYLEGRDDHSGAMLKINGIPIALTDATGDFYFRWQLPTAASTTITVTAEFPGYLWAQTVQTVDRSLIFELPDVCLLGGDVSGPDSTEVTPPAGCASTDPVTVPGPPDGQVDLFDTTLVSLEQGLNNTDPGWGPDPCRPGVPFLGYRADINGDGRVDGQDLAIVYGNIGKLAPLPWVCNPR